MTHLMGLRGPPGQARLEARCTPATHPAGREAPPEAGFP